LSNLFKGLSAFPLTPVTEDGRLDTDLLQQFLDRIVVAGAGSIGFLGSTGGYVYLTPKQRRDALRAAIECLAGRIPLIVGVGALTTPVVQDLARDAQRAGADGLLLAPVSYQPLTDAEVFHHFEAVAGAGDLPLCIYNNPGTTKFTFSPDLIARLSGLPNVAAVKMPLPADGDFRGELRNLRALTHADFSIGHSGDWGAREALLAGSACWYSVVAGVLPGPASALTRAAQSGDEQAAQRIDTLFAPLWQLFRAHGSFRVMYAVAGLLGLGNLAPPAPILSLAPEVQDHVAQAIAPLRATSF